MGAWFANFLSRNGYEIIISDKRTLHPRSSTRKKRFRFVKDPTEAAQLSQITILATPTLTTRKLLRTITPKLDPTTLIVEISSVKQPVRNTIQSLTRHGAQILSIHPMFGPGAKSLRGKSIIVARQPRNCTQAKRLLSKLATNGASIVHSSLEEHDKLTATTLALPHLINLAFIETIRRTGLPLGKVRELGGTTSKLQLLIAESLHHENPNNEASILADNKHNMRIFNAYIQHVNRLRRIIQGKNKPELLRRLRKDAIYVRRDRLFRTAPERFIAAVEASTCN